MKQVILLILVCGFICNDAFAQNPTSEDLLAEKYWKKAKKTNYQNTYLMLDGMQLLDNYSTLFFLLEQPLGNKFRLSHGIGPVINAEWLRLDFNNSQIRYKDLKHFGFKLQEEIKYLLGDPTDNQQPYVGLGLQMNYSNFRNAPLVERFGDSANNTSYFRSRKQDVKRIKYAVYFAYGKSFLISDRLVFGLSSSLGFQYIDMKLSESSSGASYVNRSRPSGNLGTGVHFAISGRIGYRFFRAH